MSIQNDIIESLYETLTNDADLKDYVKDSNIFKGFPSSEQNSCKNFIVIEPSSFDIVNSLNVNKAENRNYKFAFQVTIHAGFTAEHPQDTLEKFLDFTSKICNSIDQSTSIQSNTSIYGFRFISKKDESFLDKILFRESTITYEFTGTYKQGNL